MKKKFLKRAAAFTVASLMAVGTFTVLPEECFQQFEITVSAADIVKSGKCGDNITYTVDSNGLITISGTGEMYDHVWYYPDSNPFLEAVECIIEDGVTSIGSHAFRSCGKLTKVYIPDSITKINIYAFSDCKNLTNVNLPNSIKSIGEGAFENSGLININIPNDITSIENFTFCFCKDLTSVTIPQSVTSIGHCAFQGCKSLAYINIPYGVTSIEGAAFQDCSNLTNVILSNSVINIGASAFYECKSLTNITIPDSVRSIGGSAFFGCSLTSITLPDSVTSIEDFAFSFCENLSNVAIPNSIDTVNDATFRYCTNLTSIIIPNSVTKIGSGTFACCNNLTRILIPNSVTEISENTISYGADGVTSTNVGYVFGGCTNLIIYGYEDSYAQSYAEKHNIPFEYACNFYSPVVHNLEYVPEKSATATEHGCKEHWICTVCGNVFADEDGTNETTLEALMNHNLEATSEKIPTCTEGGNKPYWNCVVCGKYFNDEDCTTEITLEEAELSPTGHSYDDGVVTIEPTEQTEGEKTYTCTNCGATKTEVIAKLEHIHNKGDELMSDETGHWYTCDGCGEKLDFSTHTEDNGMVTVEPTVNTEGQKVYKCTVCDYTTRTETIAKLEGGNNNPTEPSKPSQPSEPSTPTPPSNPSQPQQPEKNESETNVDVKKGWGNVVKEINKANDNSKINVDMGNSTNVPKNVMNAIKGKNVDIVLDMGDGITWTINGKDVTDPQSINFSVTKKKNQIPEDMISDPSNTIPLVLAHNGNFGCSATLSIDLKGNDNKVANLYYYNTKTKELEFVDSSVIVNGKASLVFTHASDWAIVISDTSAEYEDVSSAAGAYETYDNSQAPLCIIVIILAVLGFSYIIITKRLTKHKR